MSKNGTTDNTERIIKLESDAYHHENNIKDLIYRMKTQEETNKHLERLASFVELQADYNKKQEKHNEKMVKVMHGVEMNLTNLNRDVKEVKGEVSDVKERVDTIEEEEISELKEMHKQSNVNKWKVVTGVASTLLAALIIWIVTSFMAGTIQ